MTLPPPTPGPSNAALVSTLAHGLDILRLFTDDHQAVSVSEMARAIGVHRSNASRLASTLQSMGFLARDSEGAGAAYRLGPQLIRLGRLAAQGTDLVRQTLGPLRRLVQLTGETGHIGVLDGGDAVTVAVVDGWHTVRMHSMVDKRSPAYNSSLGKACLAGLDEAEVRALYRGRRLTPKTPNSVTSQAQLLRVLAETRRRGYAVDDEELELGLRCLAAPVRDAAGRTVASLGISGPALRLTEAAQDELARQVMTAAAQASAALGFSD